MTANSQGPSLAPVYGPSARRSSGRASEGVGLWGAEASWPGLVNLVQTSPGILVPKVFTFTLLGYTFRTAQAITVQITRNGTPILTHAISANGSLPVSLAFSAGQVLGFRVSNVGGGGAEGLWLGLR
jgi:hypothetical protein